MELIGKVSFQVPTCELESYLKAQRVLNNQRSLGLTKNNCLLEFEPVTNSITRGLKLSEIFSDLEVVHDLDDDYHVVLCRSNNMGFIVVSSNFATTHISDKPFVSLKVGFDPNAAHQVLFVYNSSTSYETISFSKQPTDSGDNLRSALHWQLKLARQAIIEAKNEVRRLGKLASLAAKDLAGESLSPSENDVVRSLFDRDVKAPSISPQLQVEPLKGHFHNDTLLLCIKVKNVSSRIRNLSVSIDDCQGYRVVRDHHELSLPKYIQKQMTTGFLETVFGIQASKEMEFNENVGFVVKMPFSLSPHVDVKLKYESAKEVKLQSVPRLFINDDLKMSSIEEVILARILTCNHRRLLKVFSEIDRGFDLATLMKEYLCSLPDMMTYYNSDLVALVFKQNSHCYNMAIHTDCETSLRRLVSQLYSKTDIDVVICEQKTVVDDRQDKKSALVNELNAISFGLEANEVKTDDVFLA